MCVAADFVRDGVFVVDVGTDHAYLPIELARRGRVRGILACDIVEGPLENARKNISAVGLDSIIKLRQSDGLSRVGPHEADDIIIAGMGGDLIARIIAAAEWVKEGRHNLILQPVTSADDLRDWLCDNGFQIAAERAVLDSGRLYTVMLVSYSGERRQYGPEYRYIGEISGATADGRDYMMRQAARLRRHANSLSNAAAVHPEAEQLMLTADIIERKARCGE